jgi:hypothetical protein
MYTQRAHKVIHFEINAAAKGQVLFLMQYGKEQGIFADTFGKRVVFTETLGWEADKSNKGTATQADQSPRQLYLQHLSDRTTGRG